MIITAYAATRDYLPERQEMEIPEGFLAKQLIARLGRLYPAGRDLLSTCKIAVNDRILLEDDTISENTTLSLFPPPGGG